MTQNFDWLGSSPQPREPQSEHVCDFWTVRGPSDRDLMCAAFRVDTGLELRVAYDAENIVATELFRGPQSAERVAETADVWRRTLMAKGFREISFS